MRSSLAFVLALMTAAACGKSTGGGGGGGGGGGPDANDLGTPAFSVTTPEFALMPGQEVTYCYYFHTPNTDFVINKWTSSLTPGGHHLIVFTGGPTMPDGLDMTNSCGLGTGGQGALTNPSVWEYASQVPQGELDLPSDDGTGKPLGQKIAANTEAAIQMHYLNSGDSTLMVHDELAAYALPAGTDYTETDAYITYNADISIPANSMNTLVTASCALPSGVKFWTMSTHSHKQSVETKVMDGTNMLLDSTDWEHPTIQEWATPQTFYSFSNAQLTWSCNYDNDAPPPYEPTGTSNANVMIHDGPSAATNEMCMAVGYFFPATGPYFGLWADFTNSGMPQCFTQQF